MDDHTSCTTPIIKLGSWSSCYNTLILPNVENSKENAPPTCPPYVMSIVRESPDDHCRLGHSAFNVLGSSPKNRLIFSNNTPCYSTCLDSIVQNHLVGFNRKASSPRTQPSWIFFEKSSTECFKVINGHVWYFRPGRGNRSCSRKNVFNKAMKYK